MRFTVLAIASLLLLLCGCVSPQKLKDTEQSYETFEQQKQARDASQRCTDAGAIPGSMEHFECEMAKPAAPAAGAAPAPK